jgi:hypothetical protein
MQDLPHHYVNGLQSHFWSRLSLIALSCLSEPFPGRHALSGMH